MKTRSKSVPCKNSKGHIDINDSSSSSSSSSADITPNVNEENTKAVVITGSNTTESTETNSGNSISSQGVHEQNFSSANVESARTLNVWTFATKLPNERCQCNACGKVLSRKNYSTSGIRKHLSQCIKINEFLPSKVNKSKNVHALGPDKIKELNELVYECIIRDGRSFNDLRKPGIRKLLKHILPSKLN